MIELLITDIDEARAKMVKFITDIKFRNSVRIISELEHDQTIRQMIDRAMSWYVKPIDGVFSLIHMKILGVDDNKELIHISDEQLYNELNIAVAKSVHNFDDDETDIMRI